MQPWTGNVLSVFELIADPQDAMKCDPTFGCETTQGAVAGKQRPLSSFCDGKGEGIGS